MTHANTFAASEEASNIESMMNNLNAPSDDFFGSSGSRRPTNTMSK
jgi:hypothetical protein